MIYHVTVGDRTVTVELHGDHATVDGRRVEAHLVRVGSGPVRGLFVDGASRRFAAALVGGGSWVLHMGGRRFQAEVVDERTRAIRAMTGSGAAARGPRPVVAPMPGMVVRVEVSEGDRVRAGQGVVIVEAMKMENELVAEGDGVVGRVLVSEGQAVEKDQLLVELVADDTDAEGPS